MDATTAGTMVRDWGCNNIVMGNSSNTLVSIYHLFTGGDLALFISGLQQAVNKVKKMAGEETKDLSSSAMGVAA